MTFHPSPPPQQSPRPGVQYFKQFQRKPFKVAGSATPVRRAVSWRRTFDSQQSYSPPAIVAVPSGVVLSVGERTTMLGPHGTTIWQRHDLASPIAASGNRIYASSPTGAVEIGSATGRVVARYGSCPRAQLQWLVPTTDGVLTGCGSQQGDATLTTWNRSGDSRRQFVYRSGNVNAAGWRPIGDRYALLYGSADGAQLAEREAVVDLWSGRVIATFADLQFAGLDRRALYLWSKTDTPGLGSTLELHRMRLSDGHDQVVGELQLTTGDDTVTAPVSLYVRGGYTYFAYGDRLFRYPYPFRGIPDLVQSNVGPGPLFQSGFALMGAGSEIRLADLDTGIERLLSSNANSLSFNSSGPVATWKTGGRLDMYDMRDGSFVSIGTHCAVLQAAASHKFWYLLCRKTNGRFTVQAVRKAR